MMQNQNKHESKRAKYIMVEAEPKKETSQKLMEEDRIVIPQDYDGTLGNKKRRYDETFAL